MPELSRTLISDVVTLVLGRSDRLKSTRIDQSKLDRESFHTRCRRWAHSSNVLMLDAGPKITDGKEQDSLALRVWVRKKSPRGDLSRAVPNLIKHPALPDIPTDVINVGSKSSIFREASQRSIRPGRTCSRMDDQIGTGALTCIGRRGGSTYALTAGHVLTLSGASRRRIQVHGAGFSSGGFFDPVGMVNASDIKLTLNEVNRNDIAAFKLNARLPIPVDPRPLRIGPVMGVRAANTLERGEWIHLYGAVSQRVFRGRIWRNRVSEPVSFFGHYEIADYIDARFDLQNRPKKGDSGSLVCDMRGFAIGYYIGGKSNSTVRIILPIMRALTVLGIRPVWE